MKKKTDKNNVVSGSSGSDDVWELRGERVKGFKMSFPHTHLPSNRKIDTIILISIKIK